MTIAKSLDMHTVAEGVEDAETLDHLREIGVDYAQGYHLGRPAPVELEGSAGERQLELDAAEQAPALERLGVGAVEGVARARAPAIP